MIVAVATTATSTTNVIDVAVVAPTGTAAASLPAVLLMLLY
jgi:hypothetical protein